MICEGRPIYVVIEIFRPLCGTAGHLSKWFSRKRPEPQPEPTANKENCRSKDKRKSYQIPGECTEVVKKEEKIPPLSHQQDASKKEAEKTKQNKKAGVEQKCDHHQQQQNERQ